MTRHFLIALQFLTRLPLRIDGDLTDADLGRSVVYYPFVGMLLGVTLVAAQWLLANLPEMLQAALLLVIWVGITGALHLDGLADSADAWLGGHGDREKTLSIMKDPRSGPMGVTAVVLVLLIKFAALAALCESANAVGIALAAILGRTVLPLLFLSTPYVRSGGLGAPLAAHLPRRAAVGSVAATCIASVAMAGADGVTLVLASALVFLALRTAMLRRLGGTTGDIAGALVEITEAAVLVVFALL